MEMLRLFAWLHVHAVLRKVGGTRHVRNGERSKKIKVVHGRTNAAAAQQRRRDARACTQRHFCCSVAGDVPILYNARSGRAGTQNREREVFIDHMTPSEVAPRVKRSEATAMLILFQMVCVCEVSKALHHLPYLRYATYVPRTAAGC